MIKNQKIIVTGGAGFIGSHLCEKLSKGNLNEVFSIDNYFTGSKENHCSNTTYIDGCSSKINDLIDFKPDIIFHLGEYSRVEQSFSDIEKINEFNFLATKAVFEFCRKNKVRIIYAGSSTKFGDDGGNINASPYAWSKASNTNLLVNYGKWFDLDFSIVYFYNVYGGNEIASGKYSTLIAKYIDNYKKKLPLTVTLPGTQRRNFTYIDDIISGLLLVGEKGKGDNYGIGSSKSYSVIEVAEMFDCEIKYTTHPPPTRMDAKVINQQLIDLGWCESVSLEEYIKSQIKLVP